MNSPPGSPDPPQHTAKGRAWQPPAPEELGSLIHDCEITRLIGRGGMGAVYEGRQIALDRRVAVKILPVDLADGEAGFAERFKNEARAMARLSHPGIVTVHDCGETGVGRFVPEAPSGERRAVDSPPHPSLLYIVMEFIDGTDVARMIVEQGRLHSEHAMAITAHVCDALAYAHERGIIHRDIKPANIMVGYDGVVKVADFGLAKISTGGGTMGLTQSGQMMGTLHYMAPEALTLGTAVDHRADIYAVGVMLHQMLTGKLPQGLFEMPSLQVPGLDPRYDGIIARALREDRSLRYQSVRELRSDLDSILTQPVVQVAADTPQAPAALPTEVRPKRPAAQPYRPPQPRTAPRAPVKRASPLPWVLAMLIAGAGAWFFMAREKPEPPPQSPERPAVTTIETKPVASPTTQPPAAASKPALTPTTTTGTPPSGTTLPAAASKGNPFTNSLGMKFVPVPIAGGPSHGKLVLFSIWETRVQDYQIFAAETKRDWPAPPFPQTPAQPAVNASAEDAVAFCDWLTNREQQAGWLQPGERYMLPSDHEWSCAAGIGEREDATRPAKDKHLKIPDVFPWGAAYPPPSGAGNYNGEEAAQRTFSNTVKPLTGYRDAYPGLAPVGSFTANPLGLFDLGGNVWEWAEDRASAPPAVVIRGATFLNSPARELWSCWRLAVASNLREKDKGFRVVLTNGKHATPAAMPAELAAPDSPGLRRGLVSWWTADGDARDSIGANHGALVGSAGYAEGLYGKAFQFDGGHVEIPDAPNLDFGTDANFTVTFWAYRTGDNPVFHLFGKRGDKRGEKVSLGYQLGFSRIPSQFPASEWVFWALAYDGAKQTIYINGVPSFTYGKINPGGAVAFRIGRSGDFEGFKGRIDDMRVYNRALGATEIESLFAMRDAKPSTTVPELAALEQQFQKLQAERVTSVFDTGVAQLNTSYLGGLGREIGKERAAGRLDAVLALEEERKLIAAKQPVPADDVAQTIAAVKNLRATYRDAYAMLAAARATNLKTLTDPLSTRLKTLEADLTKANRITDAKAVRDYREQLGAHSSAVAAAWSTSNPFVNSLGMKFVPVPGTDVLFCTTLTRLTDYDAFAAETPGIQRTGDNGGESRSRNLFPMNALSWNHAKAFCDWLGRKENCEYRLPTDREWSIAVGIGDREFKSATPQELDGKLAGVCPWGSQWPPPSLAGSYCDETYAEMCKRNKFTGAPHIRGYTDGETAIAPVEAFKPNKLGLHDMGGNLWQWCEDWYDAARTRKLLRGGCWDDAAKERLLSSARWPNVPGFTETNTNRTGFRCVVLTSSIKSNGKPPANVAATSATAAQPQAAPAAAAVPATTGFSNTLGMAFEGQRFENSLGMKFVSLPGTKALMCIHETRVSDYTAFAAANPGTNASWRNVRSDDGAPVSVAGDHPVLNMTWAEANAFCTWLGTKEGSTYRLPTDREWSIAVGIASREMAGSTPKQLHNKLREYPWGTQWPPPPGAGNFGDTTSATVAPKLKPIKGYNDGNATTAPVMSFPPNKLGIYDLAGNAWEYVSDFYDDTQQAHVLRGGGWAWSDREWLNSSARDAFPVTGRMNIVGFRVMVELPATPAPAPPATPPAK